MPLSEKELQNGSFFENSKNRLKLCISVYECSSSFDLLEVSFCNENLEVCVKFILKC